MYYSYVFVEYSHEQSAIDAQTHLNDYALDKNHTFKANLLSDLEKYSLLDLEKQNDTPVPYNDPVR